MMQFIIILWNLHLEDLLLKYLIFLRLLLLTLDLPLNLLALSIFIKNLEKYCSLTN